MTDKTLWSAMLTDAIEMPSDHPDRVGVLQALERARMSAVAKAGTPTSPEWYSAAVASVEAEPDVSVQQMVFRILAKAYRQRRNEALT